MQTFLPYADPLASARALDWKRLGNQRVEANLIIKILSDPGLWDKSRWKHHPALLMWDGHLEALKLYYNMMVAEWIKRGYKNNMPLYEIWDESVVFPYWFGLPKFHKSHRANLKRKAMMGNLEEWYSSTLLDYNDLDPEMPYWWPVTWEKTNG